MTIVICYLLYTVMVAYINFGVSAFSNRTPPQAGNSCLYRRYPTEATEDGSLEPLPAEYLWLVNHLAVAVQTTHRG